MSGTLSFSFSPPTSLSSFIAIRVPPIQFNTFAGTPPRLITTDMLSGCGGISLPSPLSDILNLLASGAAFVQSIANSVMNQISAALAAITAPLNALIATATGAVQSALQGLASAIAATGLAALGSQVSNIVNNMPALASLISQAGQINAAMGLPAPPSLASIFAPIVAGGLNTALAPVLSAVSAIQSAVQNAATAGVAAIAGVVSTLSSALTNAVSAVVGTVTGLINGMMSAIQNALSSLINLASAAALSVVCAAASELNSFISSIASAALLAALPSPSDTGGDDSGGGDDTGGGGANGTSNTGPITGMVVVPAHPGTSYAVGDLFRIDPTMTLSSGDAIGIVTAIGLDGAVTGVAITGTGTNPGTGYHANTFLPTHVLTGTGDNAMRVNITTITLSGPIADLLVVQNHTGLLYAVGDLFQIDPSLTLSSGDAVGLVTAIGGNGTVTGVAISGTGTNAGTGYHPNTFLPTRVLTGNGDDSLRVNVATITTI